MAASAVIGNAAIAEVAIAELPLPPSSPFVPCPSLRPLQYRQGWYATQETSYVTLPAVAVTQVPYSSIPAWSVYQREYVQRQPVQPIAATLGATPPVTPDSPSTGAWIQKWNTYSREYVQGRVVYPPNVFDRGNQGNVALPPPFLQNWAVYTREYIQGNVQRFGTVPANTLSPAFSQPFKTPWRVDLYPVQQPVDAFVTTLVVPPPVISFVPPTNVRPLQYRTDWRQDRLIDGITVASVIPGTAFVPSQIVRPLQHRLGWQQLRTADFVVPTNQPLNLTFYPFAAGPRDLQSREGWTMYRELGQAVFAQTITQDPNAPVVCDEEIYEFWDIAPYPRQQPKVGIATTAPLIPRSVSYTVSGGIIFGGSPNYVRAYKWTPAGGIVFAGNASYVGTSTGVVVPTYIYNRRFYTKLDGKR